jgi:Cu+-exporting ATPase
MRTRIELPVGGMTCAGCAARIGRALSELDGVAAAHVNFAAERAILELGEPATEDEGARSSVPEGEGRAGRAAPEGGGRTTAASASVPPAPAVSPAARERVRAAGIARIRALGFRVPLTEDEERASRRVGPPWGLLLAAALTAMVQLLEAAGFAGRAPLVAGMGTLAVWGPGLRFHRKALADLRHGGLAMEALISLGTLTAWSWSVAAWLGKGSGGLHFGAAAMIITAVLFGRWLEEVARRRATRALRLGHREQDGEVELADGTRIGPGALQPGQRFRVRAGERLAADGVVREGRASLDESLLTGESRPRVVRTGDEVAQGSIDLDGALLVEATRVGEKASEARLRGLVRAAQARRAPLQRLVDRVTRVFVPAIVLLALGTAGVHLLLGAPASTAVERAVAVLLIACPCALGLATPMAFLIASSAGVRQGILIKGADRLESAHGLDVLVLDKTGTLTEGRPSLVAVHPMKPAAEAEILALALALEGASRHPLAAALRAHAAERGPEAAEGLTELEERPGAGVQARQGARTVRLGRARFALTTSAHRRAAEALGARARLAEEAVTPAWLADDERLLGLLVFADTLHPEARDSVAALRRLGLELRLASGDTEPSVRTLARELGIEHARAELRPEDKVALVRELRDQGRRVGFAGDGLNDAPALAEADLGLALHRGAHLAHDAAGFVLLRDGCAAIPAALHLARRARSILRGNLWWAFAYNLAALPLAITGLLQPVHAALAMSLSSLFVVGNSLRLSARPEAPLRSRPHSP